MWHNHVFAFTTTRLGLLCSFLIYSAVTNPTPLQANPPLCDKDLFGSPNIKDCYEAMFWIPYINAPVKDTPDAKALRIFAEPQFLDPPFKAVKNPFAPKAIVQLPKVWKFGMSTWIRSPLHLYQRYPCCIPFWRQYL